MLFYVLNLGLRNNNDSFTSPFHFYFLLLTSDYILPTTTYYLLLTFFSFLAPNSEPFLAFKEPKHTKGGE